jgi:hypothetical protein
VRTGYRGQGNGAPLGTTSFDQHTGAALGHALPPGELAHLSGQFGRYDGLVLVLGGAALVVLATARFVRTTRLLDEPQAHQARTGRLELILCGWLVLVVASYSLYLAFA